MTKVKLESALGAAAEVAIEGIRGRLYSKPGMRIMVVAEFAHTERTQPAPDEDKAATVKLGMKLMEVAHGEDQENFLRKAMQALKLQRTAYGTFDEETGQLELSASTLEDLSDDLAMREVARLRAAMAYQGDRLQRLGSQPFTEAQMRTEIRKCQKVVQAALDWREEEIGAPR